jgi:hypothetical protein
MCGHPGVGGEFTRVVSRCAAGPKIIRIPERRCAADPKIIRIPERRCAADPKIIRILERRCAADQRIRLARLLFVRSKSVHLWRSWVYRRSQNRSRVGVVIKNIKNAGLSRSRLCW